MLYVCINVRLHFESVAVLHFHCTGHNNIAVGCDGKIYIQQKRWIKSFDPVTQKVEDVLSEKFVRKIPRSTNTDSPCLGNSCFVQVARLSVRGRQLRL